LQGKTGKKAVAAALLLIEPVPKPIDCALNAHGFKNSLISRFFY
jgi:hypothetical protein